jgi:hypothetical protein
MRIRRLEDHVVRGPSDSGVDGQALGPIFLKSHGSAKNQTCMKMLVLGRRDRGRSLHSSLPISVALYLRGTQPSNLSSTVEHTSTHALEFPSITKSLDTIHSQARVDPHHNCEGAQSQDIRIEDRASLRRRPPENCNNTGAQRRTGQHWRRAVSIMMVGAKLNIMHLFTMFSRENAVVVDSDRENITDMSS